MRNTLLNAKKPFKFIYHNKNPKQISFSPLLPKTSKLNVESPEVGKDLKENSRLIIFTWNGKGKKR